ncbi:uncharacterized protein N0V89_003707 [Didymosphaeria variabile]|uniref:RRM domain-containing protein n=1 Tax=Didymosphaeria variabile TaxID=1932322 RepID=A0A9W8XP12_9PLEO|nr:uncharacterized protein N0V89_003707 [Didymosphaeria variabile]KAJ4355687.1 hypothetical protein N0V89_003707 [Didymosphaeria variabile]
MNRKSLHGAPPRGPPRPPYGSQDARSGSNFPTQAPAPIGGISLKKAAVRVARPAGPVPGTPSSAGGPAPPVVASPKVEDGHAMAASTANAPSAPSLAESISSISKEEAALEELWARLNSPSMLSTPTLAKENEESASIANYKADSTNASKSFPPGVQVQQPAAPSAASTANTETDSTNASMSFPPGVQVEMPLPKGGLVAIKEEPVEDEMSPAPAESNPDESTPEMKSEERTVKKAIGTDLEQLSLQDIEREYLLKAAEYLTSLPSDVGPTAETVKNATTKLGRPYAPSAILEPDVVEVLKGRYVDAIFTFLDGINKSHKSVTKDQIADILVKGDGNFLHLCTMLAEQGFISIENLDHVVGLSKAVESVLPEDEDSESSTLAPAATSKDPLEGMTSWPAREKRENAPKCRTCLLTGLPENISFNRLQALVWGGRIESLQLPKSGSGKAIVKFFTAEACQKYFDVTENGITIPGTKTVVFVEKAEGPNSVNDVLAACTEGDATRCVRAYDADEDWGDVMLMKLATRAKGGQPKREVDTIKRGKTARGRSYIEFRFAKFYAALQFKRELMEDQEWEHCTIIYAPDPCEIAQGIHIKDEVEKVKPSGSS